MANAKHRIRIGEFDSAHLHALTSTVEVCDVAGRVLGAFYPGDRVPQLNLSNRHYLPKSWRGDDVSRGEGESRDGIARFAVVNPLRVYFDVDEGDKRVKVWCVYVQGRD